MPEERARIIGEKLIEAQDLINRGSEHVSQGMATINKGRTLLSKGHKLLDEIEVLKYAPHPEEDTITRQMLKLARASELDDPDEKESYFHA